MKVLKYLMILVSMISCFTLSGCDFTGNNSNTGEIVVTNNDGFVLEGNIEEGTTLETTKIAGNVEEGLRVIKSLYYEDYDRNKAIYIYDIRLVKDGCEIQPNENVKIKIPFEAEESTNYIVFHIKDNDVVDRINHLIDDNYIVFETNSFSYFVIAHEKKIVQPIKYTLKVEVNDSSKGKIFEKDTIVDYSSGKEFVRGYRMTLTASSARGYELKGWYLVEGTNETLLSCAKNYAFIIDSDMSIKAVFDEKVTINLYIDGPSITDLSVIGEIIFKMKGYERKFSSNGYVTMSIAKGTEVTLDARAYKGWEFIEWYYYFEHDYSIDDNKYYVDDVQYMFIANDDAYFHACFAGIPEELVFSVESLTIMCDNGYSGLTGCFETTITIGSTLVECYKESYIYVYFADGETMVECYYGDGYTIDDSEVDTNKVGRYEVKYIYTGYSPNGPITMSIFINVVE